MVTFGNGRVAAVRLDCSRAARRLPKFALMGRPKRAVGHSQVPQ
jgi:hypothetical protein